MLLKILYIWFKFLFWFYVAHALSCSAHLFRVLQDLGWSFLPFVTKYSVHCVEMFFSVMLFLLIIQKNFATGSSLILAEYPLVGSLWADLDHICRTDWHRVCNGCNASLQTAEGGYFKFCRQQSGKIDDRLLSVGEYRRQAAVSRG